MQKFTLNLPHFKKTSLLKILIISILIFGIFFRFFNLDKKIYWGDETTSLLRISGYTYSELNQKFSQGKVIDVKDLYQYQYPNNGRSLADTLNSLAQEDAHHPPLFYILGRWWMHWFGHSVGVIRSLAAVISLLVFPNSL